MEKTAIFVDGGFYKKRANVLFGEKSPEERADELVSYCKNHLYEGDKKNKRKTGDLYRIFYYDCPPYDKNIYNPLTGKPVNYKKDPQYQWNIDFFQALASKRKVALRMGELLDGSAGYMLKPTVFKKLCRKEISIDDITEKDLILDIKQKGVDMRIGLDISSVAFKKQVQRAILISGDSDFVPAAKHARREGLDFILDPMWNETKPSLLLHIDGLKTWAPHPKRTKTKENTKED